MCEYRAPGSERGDTHRQGWSKLLTPGAGLIVATSGTEISRWCYNNSIQGNAMEEAFSSCLISKKKVELPIAIRTHDLPAYHAGALSHQISSLGWYQIQASKG